MKQKDWRAGYVLNAQNITVYYYLWKQTLYIIDPGSTLPALEWIRKEPFSLLEQIGPFCFIRDCAFLWISCGLRILMMQSFIMFISVA